MRWRWRATILATGMRLPLALGACAITSGMLLLGGLVATELNPMPIVNVVTARIVNPGLRKYVRAA